MILVFLVVVWAAFLLPSVLRRYSRKASIGSVDTFHHALEVLDHTEPERRRHVERALGETPRSLLPPVVPPDPRPAAAPYPRLVVLRADGTPLPMPEPAAPATATGNVGAVDDRPSPGEGGPARAGLAADRARSRIARKRRRDALLTLVAVTLGTGVLGLFGPLEFLWVVTFLGGLATVAFVALAVRAQMIEEERRQKLRYLSSAPADPRVFAGTPADDPAGLDADEALEAVAGHG